MSARPALNSAEPLRRIVARPQGGLAWLAGALAVAVLIGLATPRLSPVTAIALAVLVALPLTVAMRPVSILALLVAAVFLETIDIGGVTISRLVAPVALLVTAAALLQGRATIKVASPLVWAACYSAWAFASGFWTVSLPGTTFLLGSLAIALTFMIAFATLIESERDLRQVLELIAIAALFTGAFALASYFGQGGRASGGRGDPNTFAAYQLVALPLVLVLATDAREQWRRILFYGTAGVIVASVMASLSRGGVITFAAILLAIGLLPSRRSFFRSRAQKTAVLAVIVLAAGIGFKVTEEALLPRFDAIFTTSGATGSGRLNEWRAAWASVQERPYLGLGFGAFPAVSNQLMQETPGVDLENFDLRPDGILVHNTYLGSLAELGIPGLVLFLGLLTSIALTLRRAVRQAPTVANDFLRRVSGALQVSLAAWGTSAVFLSVETARSIWILIGLVLAVDKLVTRAAADPAPAAPMLPSRTAD